jgi:hypothetical protein
VPLVSPQAPVAWKTAAPSGGGIWGPGGLSSDGMSVFAVTGNANWGTTVCSGTMPAWSTASTNAVVRLGPNASFSGRSADYFACSDWFALDCQDLDLGGSASMLLDMPGATHSQLMVALGKDQYLYLLDRSNLGGIGGQLVKSTSKVSTSEIINAGTVYTTAAGTYVAFKAGCPTGSGDVVAVKIDSSLNVTPAWCATQNGRGSPFYTDDGSGTQGIVWGIGAESSNQLFGWNAECRHRCAHF